MSKDERIHQPCPYPACGSSNAFNYNTVEMVGFCQSCKTPYPSNKPMFDWAKEDYPLKDNKDQNTRKLRISQVPVARGTYEGIRGLDADVAELYSIQKQYDAEGNPVRYAFKWPGNVKYRSYDYKGEGEYGVDEKDFGKKASGVYDGALFGPNFNANSSTRIYITEGEFDAASLFQILGKKFPCKSLNSSSLSAKDIKEIEKELRPFKEIIYAGELDKAGRPCADKLFEVFPDKFYYVPMTKHKDANAFLMAGDGEDLKWSAVKYQRYAPENFFIGDVAVAEAIRTENPYEYVPTGHSQLDSKMRGLIKGGLTFIKAPRGGGKTELCRFFETGLLRNSPDVRIALLHMEEMKSTTYRGMATYELDANVRTKEDAKNNGYTEDQVIEAAQRMADGERTIIFEMRGHDDPLQLLEYVRRAAAVYGADYIFIDHVQRLAYLSSAGVDGATSTLTTLGARMAQLAKELNIGVVFISQVNDDGRTKYAASLEEEAIVCLKLERDTESEDELVRNTTNFVLDKNRPFANLGKAGAIYYDPDTTCLSETTFEGV